jgi:CRP/FNR family transcriptional regulator
MSAELQFLRKIALFRDLADHELAKIGELLIERRYARGEMIFAEDQTGNSMYVVKEGRVKVSRWLPSGREVILAFHPEGDYFGEMALLDGQTIPATVTAVEASTILSLDRAQFLGLLRERSFAMALLRTLCGRCRDAWHQIEVLTHHNAEARIRMALHQLCRRKGKPTTEGVRLDDRLTHRELASMAGVTRETATRVLGHLIEQGLLHVDRQRIVVGRPDALLETRVFD